MAIDPTAPITPIMPLPPASDVTDPAKALLAVARAATANAASVLGEIAVGGERAHPETTKTGTMAAALGATHAQPAVDVSPAVGPTIGERMATAVRSAAALAAPRQAGLAPMMANLDAAITRPETPEPVRQAARAVLDKALPTSQPVTSSALREAVQGSGVFLEARMARAAAAPPPDSAAAQVRTETAGGDMKAALLVLRAVISTWLAKTPSAVAPDSRWPSAPTDTEPTEADRPLLTSPRSGGYAPSIASRNQTPSPPTPGAASPSMASPMSVPTGTTSTPPAAIAPPADAYAEVASVIASDGAEEAPLAVAEEAAATPPPARPPSTAQPRSPLTVGWIEEEVVEIPGQGSDPAEPVLKAPPYASARPQTPSGPPPPYAGGPTTPQAAAKPDLPADAPAAELARRLLKDVGGAIARQELSQIASMPEAHHDPERIVETKTSRWVFDLPFQTPQGVSVAQFEISKDGGGGGTDGGREVERTWRARFSLDVEPLGPVHVQVALTGAMTRVGLWAERPESMARLRAGEEALGAALRQAELTPEIAVHAGSPTTALTAPGRFVDRAT